MDFSWMRRKQRFAQSFASRVLRDAAVGVEAPFRHGAHGLTLESWPRAWNVQVRTRKKFLNVSGRVVTLTPVGAGMRYERLLIGEAQKTVSGFDPC